MSQSLASLLKPIGSKAKNFTGLLIPRKKKRRRRRGGRGLANISKKQKPKSKGLNRLIKVMKCSTDDSFISCAASPPFIA